MPPTTADLPPTLTPIRRGAVIDWKATAIAEHTLALQAAALSKANLRHQSNNEALNHQLANAYDLAAKHFNTILRMRNHWSAAFLPKDLRR